jgi:hypothetical protein
MSAHAPEKRQALVVLVAMVQTLLEAVRSDCAAQLILSEE